jgi:hypothetical protein
MAREFVVETDGNLLRLIRSRRPAILRILALVAVATVGLLLGWRLSSRAFLLVPICGAPALAVAVRDALRGVRRTLWRKGAFVKIGKLELPRDEVQPWLGARAHNRWPLGAQVTLDGHAFCVPLIDVRDGDEANALADMLSRFLDRPLVRG